MQKCVSHIKAAEKQLAALKETVQAHQEKISKMAEELDAASGLKAGLAALQH